MLRRNTLDTLSRLVADGDLKLCYLIGIARSNSTVAARLLGEQLDGVVYEPAVTSAMMPRRHYARMILSAYDRARKTRQGPIALCVKDISLFLDAEKLDFIRQNAAQAVFTLRDPAAAHQSLVNQFQNEFRVLQRVDAIVNEPFEALWMAIQFAQDVPRLAGIAKTAYPTLDAPWYRRAMGGWTIESWRKIAEQFAAIDSKRVTILDASQMRAAPDAAAAALVAVARRIAPAGRKPTIELASHSRMYTRSKWASEARKSAGIKPAASRDTLTLAPFESSLVAGVMPVYRAMLDSALNPLRAERLAPQVAAE